MNVWAILGINPTDDVKEIKKRYATLVKEYHPEEHPEKYQEIVMAYKQAVSFAKRKQKQGQMFSLNREMSSEQAIVEKEEGQTEKPLNFAEIEETISQTSEEKEISSLDFSYYQELDVAQISEELDNLLEKRHFNVTEQLLEWRAFFKRYRGQEVLLFDILETKDVYQITQSSIISYIYWHFKDAKEKLHYSYDLQKLRLWNSYLVSEMPNYYSYEQLRNILEKSCETERLLDSILSDEEKINDINQWNLYFKENGSTFTEILFDKISKHYHLIRNIEIFDRYLISLATLDRGVPWMTEEREKMFHDIQEYYYRLRYPNSSESIEKLHQRELQLDKCLKYLFLGMFLLFLSMSILLRTDTPWLYYALVFIIPFSLFLRREYAAQYSIGVPKVLKSSWLLMGGLALVIAFLFLIYPTLSSPVLISILMYLSYATKTRRSNPMIISPLMGEKQSHYFIPISVFLLFSIFFSLGFQGPDAVVQIIIMSCYALFVAHARLVIVARSNIELKTKRALWPNCFVREWLLPLAAASIFVWLLSAVSREFFPEPYRLLPYAHEVDYLRTVMVMCVVLLGNLFLMGTFSKQVRRFESVYKLEMLMIPMLAILVRIVAFWYVHIHDSHVRVWNTDFTRSLLVFVMLELFWFISYSRIKKEVKLKDK